MVLLPLCYGAETTHIWCNHHSNFNFSKVSIWHYDHSNMVIPPFPLFNFSSIKILKEYLYTVKIIHNFDGTLLFQKGTMILKILFIPKGLCFKTILNSEGTLNRKVTMVLRTLLIPKGQKKEMKRRKTRQHKSRKGEKRKSSRQLNETLWCVF